MNNRALSIYLTVGLIWTILVIRLFYLQIITSSNYAERAEDNSTRLIDQIPARGLIYDRYGRLIVDNKPSFSVQVLPSEFDTTSPREIRYLARLLEMPERQIQDKLSGAWPYTPVTIQENVRFLTIVRLEEEKKDHPGIYYKVDVDRIYASEVTMPHVMGYLNQLTENTIGYYTTTEFEEGSYKIGEQVGAAGVEKFYEQELRGLKGFHRLITDARGRVINDAGIVKRPKDGYNLYMTIDQDFQRYVEMIMGQQKGCIIAVDVRNGEILAATSKPDYDLHWFTDGISSEHWQDLVQNPDKPMFNRIVQSGYAPGSTFKMITAIAGLEEGIITPETYVQCEGVYLLGGNRFRCWNLTGHGHVNLQYALTQSCDVFFYQIAWQLGINKLAKYARMFGLGELTGVDLPNERRGNIPTTDYFDSRYGRNNWKSGTVVNLGIGQGEILVTPIQMAQYVTILANAGRWQSPHFVNYASDEDGIRKLSYPVKTVEVNPANIDMVRRAMWNVVNTFEGTGKRAYVKNAQVAGKTGTSENVHGNYHGWFIGFAPYFDPEIGVVVLMENGGEGSDVAAPMSALVMNYYFNYVRNKKPFDPLDPQRPHLSFSTVR